jgi:serine protease Do
MNARLFLLAVFYTASLIQAESVKDREGAVRNDRAKMEHDDRWIYNDWQKGLDEAKRTGKPLMIVLRCVPCLACMGIDAQVLLEEAELAKRLDQFVCVRLINANALDLSLFQFDYDLSFTTLFMNGDRTIYGRYGSWSHQKNSQETATAGLIKALVAALAIHTGYPGNKATLEMKQGVKMPFSTPVDIPMLAAKYKPLLDWEGKVAQSCVHCHMIGAAMQTWHRQERKPMPDEWLHPWPEPETIGLTLASEEVGRVASVMQGSEAAAAGLKPSDDILSVNGTPLISIADFSWALHRTPAKATLTVEVKRGGERMSVELSLPEGWRAKSDVTRRASIWPMRGMALGGLRIEPLAADERAKRQIPAGQTALLVTNVGQYGMHAAAKKAGFQKDDVIVEFAGKSDWTGESRIIGHLLRNHFPGDRIKVSVLRNGKRHELELPMQ